MSESVDLLIENASRLLFPGTKTAEGQPILEHASVAPTDAMERIRSLGLTVVTQPGFVFERGDAYRRDVAVRRRDELVDQLLDDKKAISVELVGLRFGQLEHRAKQVPLRQVIFIHARAREYDELLA